MFNRIDFTINELEWANVNLEHQIHILEDRIEYRKTEILYRQGLISDFQMLITSTNHPFIEMYPRDWRRAPKASK